MAEQGEAKSEVRWGVARRFEFLEWRTYWTGRVNRSDLEDYFRISTPQASADLKLYQESNPGNIRYDSTAKAFLPEPDFSPHYLKLSADRYLIQLSSIQNGAIQIGDTMFGSPPPAAVVPTVMRSVKPDILRAILRAIQHQQEIDVEYLSLTSTRTRAIAPHSLGFDGHRWHVRAWCAEHQDFRDYVLTRILSFRDIRPATGNPSDDAEWNNLVTLNITAHPELEEPQRRAIEHDYGMVDGLLKIETRIALAYYLEKRLTLDVDSDPLSPARKQLKLINRDEILAAREAARNETRTRVAAKEATSNRA